MTWTNCCEEMGKKVISENIHIEMIKMLLDLPKSATYQEVSIVCYFKGKESQVYHKVLYVKYEISFMIGNPYCL